MTIELKRVKFAYTGVPTKTTLDIPYWRIEKGTRLFLHGPSGSGKSTLLNIVSGVLPCSRGMISVLGSRLDQMSSGQRDRFRANHIGYVFQRFNLIPYLTALDNIELAKSFSQRRDRLSGREACETLLTSLHVERCEWNRPTSQLSMGQQQRVAIARALVNRPQLLIADEPTSSLDKANRDSFMSLLMPLAIEHNMTLLFASHDLDLAQYFTQVTALRDIAKVG